MESSQKGQGVVPERSWALRPRDVPSTKLSAGAQIKQDLAVCAAGCTPRSLKAGTGPNA